MTVLHSFPFPDMYAMLTSHDAAEPVRRVRTPEDPQTQSASRLSRVWRRRPAGQLPDPPGGGLPALCQAYRLQVWRLFQSCRRQSDTFCWSSSVRYSESLLILISRETVESVTPPLHRTYSVQ